MSPYPRQLATYDVMVLGAGIVGVSTALRLHRLGLDVALIDRKHPGEDASSGTSGVIRRDGFVPDVLPGMHHQLLASLFRRSGSLAGDIGQLARLMPWLTSHREACSGHGLEVYSRQMAPLRALCIQEHLDLARSLNADRFYRQGGWLQLFRHEAVFQREETERTFARVFGVIYDELDTSGATLLEPGLTGGTARAVHWPESISVSNPGAVVDAFWRGYIHEGGSFFRADAGKLDRQRGGWVLESMKGGLFARQVVVALGAWSQDLLGLLGESYPVAIKRAYHMHYRPQSGASLSRPVVDAENGFVLTPTDKGIRLTTSPELAQRDAPPNPGVLKAARKHADKVFPLGAELQETSGMGCMPCLPDCLPVMGASPSTPGLWLNFGHADDAFGLGPLCGRLLADTIAAKPPLLDISGFSPGRFDQ